ncbi:MAG: RNA polymerase sigma factor [Ktedonobacteraceae bacterium]|nr:RNA polymerase sigma factor [Ktedonobacteraceae bacterium]
MMPSDAELVAQIRAHNADAFEALSIRYREIIYRHVFSTIHDSDATEDVVQEVFLRIWTHAEQWNGRGTFKAWLFRIATNFALNHLRTLRRRKQQPLESPSDPLNEDDESSIPEWMTNHALPGPEIIVEQGERSKLLQQLVNGLPEEKREVFRMIHDAEMETSKVAETLGIPEGTVKSRLHYANRRLARAWQDATKEWEDMA